MCGLKYSESNLPQSPLKEPLLLPPQPFLFSLWLSLNAQKKTSKFPSLSLNWNHVANHQINRCSCFHGDTISGFLSLSFWHIFRNIFKYFSLNIFLSMYLSFYLHRLRPMHLYDYENSPGWCGKYKGKNKKWLEKKVWWMMIMCNI